MADKIAESSDRGSKVSCHTWLVGIDMKPVCAASKIWNKKLQDEKRK